MEVLEAVRRFQQNTLLHALQTIHIEVFALEFSLGLAQKQLIILNAMHSARVRCKITEY
jgi:hypothetical protein